jgi:hypothetical protein
LRVGSSGGFPVAAATKSRVNRQKTTGTSTAAIHGFHSSGSGRPSTGKYAIGTMAGEEDLAWSVHIRILPRREGLQLRRSRRGDDPALAASFLNDVFASFVPGKHFAWEPALAALAVLLETHASDFADEYLGNLADSPFIEFSMASRMASLCKSLRAQALTQPNRV